MTTPPQNHRYAHRLFNAYRYIEDYSEEPLNLTAIASQVCFSPYHFHRFYVPLRGKPLRTHTAAYAFHVRRVN